MPKKAAPIELTPAHIAAIQAWTESRSALNSIKDDELAKRLEVIKTVPFNADKEEGGQTLALNAGWHLALDKPINYSVDKDSQKVVACVGRLNEVNPGAAAGLIKWEAVLSVATYKGLTDAEKLLIAEIVTMKPGTPSLDLKPPTIPKA